MFRYIDMPKLVAFYLKEFSIKAGGEPSILYKFIFCLCLPFVSRAFRIARLHALAIAECTDSREQIKRVLEKLLGVSVTFVTETDDYYVAYDGSDDVADFAYDNSANTDVPLVPYSLLYNKTTIYITLNGASQETVLAYLQLLIPFYISVQIVFV